MIRPEEVKQIGPYPVRRFLAEGGGAWIFEVTDQRLGVRRALKLLKPHAISEGWFEQFEAEARLLAAIEHPNVVTLYDFGRDDATGCHYYTMTLFDGPDLAKRGTLSVAEAGSVFLDVLAGLSRLHEAGVVHGDLKPDNIFLASDGRAALGGLGIARFREEAEAATVGRTRRPGVVGTPLYMSPEHAAGEALEPPSDIFAAGLCLYRMLTGRHVYESVEGLDASSSEALLTYLGSLVRDSSTAAILRVPSQKRELPISFPANVPEAFREIITRACRVGPQDRYPDAATMREALAAALAVSVPPTSSMGRAGRNGARLAFAALGLGAGVVLAAGLVYLGLRGEAEGPRPLPSAPEVTSREPAPPVAPDVDFGTYHALVIGSDEYGSFPKLRTAVNDARAVAALLRDDYGFEVNLITEATRSQIIGALARYRQELRFRDNLLIYYAGHGWQDTKTDRGYWLPIDAQEHDPSNWISNADVTDSLKAMDAKHVLIVADSCYSGSLTREASPMPDRDRGWLPLIKKRARVVLTSGGLEPVEDAGPGGHSVFANAFLDALRENRGIVDGTMLFTRIRRPVLLNAHQTPEYGDVRFAGHGGGDFLFVRRD
jgi:hypothetical protein